VILLLVATIGTLLIGRVGVVEQRQAGADLRTKEVYSAAIGGLEFAEDWFEENWNTLAWVDTDSDGEGDFVSMPSAMEAQLNNLALSSDLYDREVVFNMLTPLSGSPKIARITVTAVAHGDSHINKTVTKEVMFGTLGVFQGSLGGSDPTVFSGPPLLAEGCVTDFGGNPDVYPYGGIAVGTTLGDGDPSTDDNGAPCLDPGSHLDVHGGTTEALSPPQSLWNTIFGPNVTEADLRALEARSPTTIHIVDSTYPHYAGQPSFNGNNWHNSLGSSTSPVILYFDSSIGCPNINGSPTIYGLVYYESTPSCTFNGWGGAEIYGTVAVAGDIDHVTANGEIHGQPVDFGQGGEPCDTGACTQVDVTETEYKLLSEIPGSWKDF
jgi:hypothetical protein